MGQKTSKALKWAIRVYSAISFIIGVGFIIWACVLQNPPKQALPLGLVILGTLALILAVFGVFQACCTRCCFSVYLSIAAIVTLAQLILIITLFANLDGTVQNLAGASRPPAKTPSPSPKPKPSPKPAAPENDEYDSALPEGFEPGFANNLNVNDRRRILQAPSNAESSTYQSIENSLEVGRYVFLVMVLLEIIALFATIVIRLRHPYEVESDFSAEDQQTARSALAQIQMESLKHSVSRGNKQATSPAPDNSFYAASGKFARSVTRSMTQKYGSFTQDTDFQPKWWQKLPGMK